jgi:hypothetical protein
VKSAACACGIAAMLLAVPATAAGQSLVLVLEGGVSVGALNPGQAGGSSWSPGYLFGAAVTRESRKITWLIGASVHKRAAGFTNARISLTSLEAPVGFRFNFFAERRTRFHVLAGGFAGYRTGARINHEFDFLSMDISLRRWELGLMFGGGVDRGDYSVGVRVYQGLVPTLLVIDDKDTYTTSVVFLFGYRLKSG